MADTLTPEARSKNMARIRSRDTGPEMLVRRAAHALGLRFRLHRKDLPGTPDLVFPSRRVAVLVHGCFWHRHAGCRMAYSPKSRTEFWKAKFVSNVERDARKIEELSAAGFPREHWTQIASTNPLERVNREVKRRADVIGIFPNDEAIIRLVGALMLETNDEWAVARRYMSLETLARVTDNPTVRLPAVAA